MVSTAAENETLALHALLRAGQVMAVLLTLPIILLPVRQGIQKGYIRMHRFAWTGPVVVAGILGTVPVLFAIAGFIETKKRLTTRKRRVGVRVED